LAFVIGLERPREDWAFRAHYHVARAIDLSKITKAPATQREAFAEHLKRFEEFNVRWNAGSALIVPSAWLRGLVNVAQTQRSRVFRPEIHRKKRILEYAERVGNIHKTCRYFVEAANDGPFEACTFWEGTDYLIPSFRGRHAVFAAPFNEDTSAKEEAPRPFVISGPASLITLSWNQAVGFLTEWDGLRRLAA
jgi:hypothetical protein